MRTCVRACMRVCLCVNVCKGVLLTHRWKLAAPSAVRVTPKPAPVSPGPSIARVVQAAAAFASQGGVCSSGVSGLCVYVCVSVRRLMQLPRLRGGTGCKCARALRDPSRRCCSSAALLRLLLLLQRVQQAPPVCSSCSSVHLSDAVPLARAVPFRHSGAVVAAAAAAGPCARPRISTSSSPASCSSCSCPWPLAARTPLLCAGPWWQACSQILHASSPMAPTRWLCVCCACVCMHVCVCASVQGRVCMCM